MRNIVLFVFSVHYILFANYSEFIAQMICNCAKKSLSLREFGIRKGLKKLVISSKIRIFIGENQ